jgi:hypothetical protein
MTSNETKQCPECNGISGHTLGCDLLPVRAATLTDNELEHLKVEHAQCPAFHAVTDFILSPDHIDVETWRLHRNRWHRAVCAAERYFDAQEFDAARAELDAAAKHESAYCSLTDSTAAFAASIGLEWEPKKTL